MKLTARNTCSVFIRKGWMIMRIMALIILIGALHVSARTTAQQITLSSDNISIEQLLSQLKKQTGYSFLLKDGIAATDQKVNVHVTRASLQQVLDQVLKPLSLTYQIEDKLVYILPAPAVILPPAIAVTVINIHGRITNEQGEPVQGATVTVKSTMKATSTDANGEFSLNGVDDKTTLIVSNIGYEKQVIKVDSQNTLNIILKISQNKLDEVHVIAYGTTTQRLNVGSISKITSEEIASQPVSNPLAALEGRIPGLLVTQTSGIPGVAFNVQIRGQNTLKSVKALPDNPLFIVDGIPFTSQNTYINQFGSAGTGSSLYNTVYGMSALSNINPYDIESIEVLRDADATSIYGSRGANGVVLITTKKGKAGKTSFGLNVWTGGSAVTRTMPMMNTPQYLQMRREAIKNDNDSLTDPNLFAPDLLTFDTTRYTDWKKYFLGRTAHVTDVNASLSGGDQNTHFLVGTGYHHESYIFPGDFGDNRASVNVNLNHSSADKKLKLDFSVNYSYDQNNSASTGDPLNAAFKLSPNYPSLINPDGSLNWVYNGIDLSDNPLGYLKQKYELKTYNLISHFQINYQLLPSLAVRSSFGYNTVNADEISQYPTASQDPTSYPVSYAYFGANNFRTWIIEPQAEWTQAILGGKLDVLVGGTWQKNTNAQTSTFGFNYSNDALMGSISAAAQTTTSDAYSLYKYSAVFGRLNYVYNNRYIVNLTGRRDGSSRFGPGKQFGNFGSIGAGWIFSETGLIKNSFPFLSYGKFRASYGSTGSDNIGDYQYLSRWASINNLNFQGGAAYLPQNLYNPNFSWAVNKKLEVGLEIGFLKDRLLGTVSWFQNRCGNQLVDFKLPIQTGFPSITANFPAVVQNTGFEIQVTSLNIKSRDFGWTSTINFTIPRNKLISFPGITNSSYNAIYIVGKSLNLIKGYRYAGVNDTTGVYQFYTAKGALTYDPDNKTDYQPIGDTGPEFYGGFRNMLSYKSFQLDIFLEFRKQTGYNYVGQISKGSPIGWCGNQPAAVLARWQNMGDHTNIQQFSQSSASGAANALNYFSYSDAALGDASFIRFKTISLSYNLPKLSGKVKIQGAKLYMNAQNLITITKYQGNDPESTSFYGMPPLRTISAGLQFIF